MKQKNRFIIHIIGYVFITDIKRTLCFYFETGSDAAVGYLSLDTPGASGIFSGLLAERRSPLLQQP